MTSKLLFTLGLLGSGLGLAGLTQLGCGGGSSGSGTTAATGSGGGSTKTTSQSASSGAGTGAAGGGGTGGGGNHEITMASPITVDGQATDATLVDAQTRDFYSFTGKAGDRLYIEALAPALQTENMGFDATVTDLTLLLTGSNMSLTMPLTYQDDGWPDFSQNAVLFVQLPSDGTYYLQVADCHGLFTSGCPNDPTMITSFEYNLAVVHTAKLPSPEVLAAAGQDGTIAKSQTVTYVTPMGGKAGEYSPATLGGDFPTATSKQVFSFTPPAASAPATGYARAEFYVQPIGSVQGGDLSDANVKIWVTDSTGATILSQADQNEFLINSSTYSPLQLSARYTPGQQYYLFVENTMTAGSATADFYFVAHYLNALVDVAEAEGVTGQGVNDTAATAQVLTAQGSAKDFFTVDGNISAPASAAMPDVDWFTFNVPAGVKQYQLQCDAARSGSGLGAFSANLFGADHTTSIVAMTETSMADLTTPQAALPAGVTTGSAMFLKLTAATQDPVVTGTQYRCYVFFQ